MVIDPKEDAYAGLVLRKNPNSKHSEKMMAEGQEEDKDKGKASS